jgi:cytochrome c-type biogenesis protein CcmH
MRDVIREQLRAGKTEDEVKAYFVERYTEWILLEPPARGFNLVVYLGPALVLGAGAVLLFVLLRRWSGRAPARVAPADSTDPDLAPWEEIRPGR